MSDHDGKVKLFPGTSDHAVALDQQPQADVIAFIEDLLARAKRGEIQAIAIAVVDPGKHTGDGWRCAVSASMHDLMASVTYLQNRMAARTNARDQADPAPKPS